MPDRKVWFITGAGRGIGSRHRQAALAPATPSSHRA